MGPLLFIIYMNVICNVSKFLYTILYADDTCVLLNGKNTELDLLSTWLKSNKLSLNTHKTFFQLFHRARMKTNNYFNIIVDNCVLTNNYFNIICKTQFRKALEYCVRPDFFL